jgi:hypothetical protein
MSKRIHILALSGLVIGVTIITILFFLSDDMIHRRNSFIRQFPPHPLTEGDTIDIKYNSYYLAGGTPHHFYLGNTTGPLHVLVLNATLTDSQHVLLQAKEIDTMKFWAARVRVDSPYFYLADGSVPVVFGGKVDKWIPSRYMYDSAFFVDYEPMSRWSFAMRSVSSKTMEYELGKMKADTPHVKIAFDLLQKQIDGKFCVDGMLHYNKNTSRLVYVYYYRNQFIVSDTNLNLEYRGKTIDTISRAQIKIATISSKNGRTHATPPLFVNKQSCVDGNLLLVNSALQAKNESREGFDNSSVIDVYNLQTGEYKFSFYIPKYSGKRMHDFKIFGDKLVVLIDKYVITYNLVRKYF